MIIAEVVQASDYAFKNDMKDEDGDVLPLGSILVRTLPSSYKTNSLMFFAKPISFNVTNIPLNGEMVILISAPNTYANNNSGFKNSYYYLPFPLNSTDDLVINQFQDFIVTGTETNKNPETRDPYTSGKTFPSPARPLPPLQPFEGDYIIQNRSGAAFRLGNSTKISNHYQHSPTFHKTGKLGDPYLALTLSTPAEGKLRLPVETPQGGADAPSKKTKSQKYRIESTSSTKVGIYAGISQKFPGIVMGNARSTDALGVGNYSDPQVILNAGRVVINANEDKLLISSKEEAVMDTKKLRIITDEHNVNFDDLVDRVEEIAKELNKLTSGRSQFSTSFGPTGVATNVAEVFRLYLLIRKFNVTLPVSGQTIPPEDTSGYDFGVNQITPDSIPNAISGGGGGGGSSSSQKSKSAIKSIKQSTGLDTSEIYASEVTKMLPTEASQKLGLSPNKLETIKNMTNNYEGTLPKLGGVGGKSNASGDLITEEGSGINTLNYNKIPTVYNKPSQNTENSQLSNDQLITSSGDSPKGKVCVMTSKVFNNSTGSIRTIKTYIAHFGSGAGDFGGWYLVSDSLGTSFQSNVLDKLSNNFLQDPKCLYRNLKNPVCGANDIIIESSITVTDKIATLQG